ncbi:hypothetical protein ANN_15298 [Periplaneta americana]|uniref:Uncharacterized protein n=1 Tax=Periplaneta americana TaxID=6978 RepID=A0ABQ8SH59_PERAM|nr:hypothetical protein ANN_15298 [Periplaneta americana]
MKLSYPFTRSGERGGQAIGANFTYPSIRKPSIQVPRAGTGPAQERHHARSECWMIDQWSGSKHELCVLAPVALYGAETWALRRSEEKRIEAFEMWIWRRMERLKWTARIRNEAVLERVGEERMILKLIRKRKRNWLDHWLRSHMPTEGCTGRNGEQEKSSG